MVAETFRISSCRAVGTARREVSGARVNIFREGPACQGRFALVRRSSPAGLCQPAYVPGWAIQRPLFWYSGRMPVAPGRRSPR